MFNEQFLNEPAVELARILVESGKGAFELCGFLAGGGPDPFVLLNHKQLLFRLRGNGRRSQACSPGKHQVEVSMMVL